MPMLALRVCKTCHVWSRKTPADLHPGQSHTRGLAGSSLPAQHQQIFIEFFHTIEHLRDKLATFDRQCV